MEDFGEPYPLPLVMRKHSTGELMDVDDFRHVLRAHVGGVVVLEAPFWIFLAGLEIGLNISISFRVTPKLT